MRSFQTLTPVLAVLALILAPAGGAHAQAAGKPKSIGAFRDWHAATHMEAGEKVCYAFTRAASSSPTLPGRGQTVLTVTQRPSGRDAVAISAGFTYPAKADVAVDVQGKDFSFYTSGRSAFARDGHDAVAAFIKGRDMAASSPGPQGKTVKDTFSLLGFSAAYEAINEACPAS